MNMSYCRYHNTLIDLQDCMEDARAHVNEEAEHPVSEEEIRCFRNMVSAMVDFLNYDIGVLDEDGELDAEQLERVCEAMSRSYEEED